METQMIRVATTQAYSCLAQREHGIEQRCNTKGHPGFLVADSGKNTMPERLGFGAATVLLPPRLTLSYMKEGDSRFYGRI